MRKYFIQHFPIIQIYIQVPYSNLPHFNPSGDTHTDFYNST